LNTPFSNLVFLPLPNSTLVVVAVVTIVNPWYDYDHRVTMVTKERDGETLNSSYSILVPPLLPQMPACAVVHGPDKISHYTPLQPLRALASPSTYIRLKQWGGVRIRLLHPAKISSSTPSPHLGSSSTS
jgi:hypothetical protein